MILQLAYDSPLLINCVEKFKSVLCYKYKVLNTNTVFSFNVKPGSIEKIIPGSATFLLIGLTSPYSWSSCPIKFDHCFCFLNCCANSVYTVRSPDCLHLWASLLKRNEETCRPCFIDTKYALCIEILTKAHTISHLDLP